MGGIGSNTFGILIRANALGLLFPQGRREVHSGGWCMQVASGTQRHAPLKACSPEPLFYCEWIRRKEAVGLQKFPPRRVLPK